MKTFFRVTLIDSSYNLHSVDNDTEVFTVDVVPDGFDMEKVYSIFDTFWNGGELYETYEDYVEAWDEDILVKEHFDALVNAYGDWCVDTLADVINALYPEMNAQIVNCDREYVFYW